MHGTNTYAKVGVGVFVLLAFVLFGYIFMQGRSATPLVDVETDEQAAVENTPSENKEPIITAAHEYEDGVHTFAGSIDLPTPCHRLTNEVVVEDDEVTVVFTITEPGSDELCAQVITPTPFVVTAEAPEEATVSATLDGEGVVFNLVEVPEGEDIQTYEFIKG